MVWLVDTQRVYKTWKIEIWHWKEPVAIATKDCIVTSLKFTHNILFIDFGSVNPSIGLFYYYSLFTSVLLRYNNNEKT